MLLQIAEAGCVPVLLKMLLAQEKQQAHAAALALNMITLAKEGKTALLEVS